MMLRIDTNTNQAAVLSFPRDLWVRIGTSNRKSRINSTLDSNDPEKIISTIYTNFGLPVDHLINVDFCAFKGLVDAVGGVAVPFEYAARDRETGLDVAAECHLSRGTRRSATCGPGSTSTSTRSRTNGCPTVRATSGGSRGSRTS